MKYNAWHEAVITQTLLGKTPEEIATFTQKDVKVIRNVLHSPAVKEKLAIAASESREIVTKGYDRLVEVKDALVDGMIRLALGAEKEQTQLGALQFLLERFPEFRKGAEMQTNILINQQLSKEETEKVNVAAGKLERMMGVLEGGNPNVVE